MAKKKNTKTTSSRYILPSENSELQSFTKKFKLDMMEQVVNSIEFAVSHKLPYTEVFQFKNSDFVITLAEKDYLNNLDNIYGYYMEKESYEHCHRVISLQNILKKKSNYNDEKQKR